MRSWEELQAYANLVASVVGRMCVRIFGFRDPIALERADELGVALQLINILRDVQEDASRGRIYLPRDELSAFGITEGDILDGRVAPDGTRSWRCRSHAHASCTRRASASPSRFPSNPPCCVRTMAGIYLGILDQIEAAPELPYVDVRGSRRPRSSG